MSEFSLYIRTLVLGCLLQTVPMSQLTGCDPENVEQIQERIEMELALDREAKDLCQSEVANLPNVERAPALIMHSKGSWTTTEEDGSTCVVKYYDRGHWTHTYDGGPKEGTQTCRLDVSPCRWPYHENAKCRVRVTRDENAYFYDWGYVYDSPEGQTLVIQRM